jgi:hypothetical protein
VVISLLLMVTGGESIYGEKFDGTGLGFGLKCANWTENIKVTKLYYLLAKISVGSNLQAGRKAAM